MRSGQGRGRLGAGNAPEYLPHLSGQATGPTRNSLARRPLLSHEQSEGQLFLQTGEPSILPVLFVLLACPY